MFNKLFSKSAKKYCSTIFILFTLFSFASCNMDPEPQSESITLQNIIGTWEQETNGWLESYTITETSFSSLNSYEGNELVFIPSETNNGYIYIKYTKSMNADWFYSETAPDVGKWYAVHVKNVKSLSLELAGAYKADGKTSTETLEEAKKEFTVENGYFSYYSELPKKIEK